MLREKGRDCILKVPLLSNIGSLFASSFSPPIKDETEAKAIIGTVVENPSDWCRELAICQSCANRVSFTIESRNQPGQSHLPTPDTVVKCHSNYVDALESPCGICHVFYPSLHWTKN